MAVNIGPRIGIEGEAEYRKQINNIVQTQKTLTAEMQKTESAFGKSASAQAKAAAKSDLLVRKIGEQERHVQKLKVGLEQSAQKFGENDTRTLKWQEALAKAETELNKLNSELDELDRKQSIGQKLQDAGASISGFGQKITTVGDTMTKYISAPIAGVGAVAVKTAMDFEDSMAKVQTIADTTSVPIDDLRGAIMDLSSDTGIAATDIADSVYNAISAGQDTASAVSFVETTAKLAKAGFADTGSALDVLTSIMNAYRLEASEAGSVSDKLITVQNRGKTTIAQLSSSMGKVIPTASAFGVSLDNVASAYVVLTKNGISTAESTTYMNSMLNELGKSGTKASEIIKKQTGKSFSELMESGSNVSDVLKVLKEEADKSNLSLADMFGSAEAGKAALSILSDGGEEFNASMKAMQESVGATQTAFDTISGTTSEKFKRAMNDLKNTGIRAGTDLITMAGPGIDAFGKKISQISTWYKNLDSDTQRMISTVGVAFAVGGPLLSGVGRLVDGFGKGVTAVGKFISLIGGLSSPGGAVLLGAAAIGTLVAAIDFSKSQHIPGYDEFMGKMDSLKQKAEEVKASLENINKNVETILDGVEVDAQPIQFLQSELHDCFDANGKLKDGMAETASVIMGELNTAMGTELPTTFSNDINANKEALEQCDAAIGSYIESMKAAAVQQAFNQDYANTLKAEAEARQALTTSAQAYNEQLAAIQATQAEMKEQQAILSEVENWEALTEEQINAKALYESLQLTLADQTAELERAGEAYLEDADAAAQAASEVSTFEEAMKLAMSSDPAERSKAAEYFANVGVNAEKAGKEMRNTLGKEIDNTTKKLNKMAEDGYHIESDFEIIGADKESKKAKNVAEKILSAIKGKTQSIEINGAATLAKAAATGILGNMVGNVSSIYVATAAAGALASANSVLSGIVGKVTNINIWEAAQSAWSELTNYFASNPVWVEVKAKVSNIASGLNIWHWANGGIVDQPTFGVFGEAGPEAFIPLSPSRRGRAMSLYREVGDILGVGAGEGARVYNSTAETTNVGGININVYAQPGQNINQIATEVSRRINAEVFRKGAVYR